MANMMNNNIKANRFLRDLVKKQTPCFVPNRNFFTSAMKPDCNASNI